MKECISFQYTSQQTWNIAYITELNAKKELYFYFRIFDSSTFEVDIIFLRLRQEIMSHFPLTDMNSKNTQCAEDIV